MNQQVLVVVICILVAPVAGAFELRLAAGLAVSVDRIAEPLEVDGVAMTVQRVTGAGVAQLARRIESLWRDQGSDVKALQQGDWTLRSRMLGTKSEVVQWRTGMGAPELLWSSLDAASAPHVTPAARLALPPGCAWGRSVSGSSGQTHYLQRSARCALPIGELSAQLQRSLPVQGWQVRSAADNGLTAERAGTQALLSLTLQPGDPGTWLTWLQVEGRR